MITVTLAAAQKLKSMIEKSQPNNNEAGIRLAIKAGGCSGFTYVPLSVAIRPDQYDNLLQSNGVRIFVDHKSFVLVDGTEIDYGSPNLLEGLEGFIFKNPKAKSTCGCGTSFQLK